MKVGELFDLPDNVVRQEGRTGVFRDEKTKVKLGRWIVVMLINKEINAIQFKGKVTTTYGHKRRNNDKMPRDGWLISLS